MKKYSWWILLGVMGISFLLSCNQSNESYHAAATNQADEKEIQYRIVNMDIDIPDTEMLNQQGEKVKFKDLLQQDQLVYVQFIFTTCPTICPVLTGHFASFQEKFTPTNEKIQLISISMDPKYDTPKRLTAYAEKFDAGTNWTFLTGKREAVEEVQKAFDYYYGNKMYHKPVTYLKKPDTDNWTVFDGFINGEELWEEYQNIRS